MSEGTLPHPASAGKFVAVPACPNLKALFGKRYRVRHEESYYAEKSEFRAAEEPWLQLVPCQHGHICPWGGDRLAACTDKAGGVARRLKALPFAVVAQDGDDGVNVVFPLEHIEEVAVIMKPRRRRRLSPEVRQSAVARLAKYRFQHAVGIASEPQESSIGSRDGSEHLPLGDGAFPGPSREVR